MKVLTAGVKGGKNKNNKGAWNKNKKQIHVQTNHHDEETANNNADGGEQPTTPTTDNRLNTDVSSSSPSTSDESTGQSGGGPLLPNGGDSLTNTQTQNLRRQLKIQHASVKLDDLYSAPPVINDDDLLATETMSQSKKSKLTTEYFWLAFCFFGIMGSFVCYGLLLEYATSGGKHLHELSFLFVTSLLYTMTASVGRYARAEKPSTIPPAQFAVLGMTSMGSTFFSVRALRYVIYPIQVLAKSCKPVPVMLMGAVMGKKYPAKKYVKVALIVSGVGLFMGGG